MLRLLEHPCARRLVVLLGVALALPTLGAGFFADDWFMLAALRRRWPHAPPWWDLYEFVTPSDDGVRADVQQNRAALGRVVRYFVQDAGIRQFLDVGTGIPKENNVHEVAQGVASDARIVYVDRDPIVLAHAHQLLRGTREGSISYIFGDLHDPQPILAEAAKTLDLSRPTAVMLFGILHFFSDADDPHELIGQLMAPLAAGSGLAARMAAAPLRTAAAA